MPGTLLDVRGLRLSFGTEEGTVRALFGVSFSVAPAETVGLVGESGCGKTVTALAVLRLLASPPAVVEGGEILFRGEDLLRLPEKRMCSVRVLICNVAACCLGERITTPSRTARGIR